MKRVVLLFLVVAVFSVQASWFGYDRGVAAARSGDSERATMLLSDELTATPDNPSLLYDAGVLAYKQHKYEQAGACFAKTVSSTRVDTLLHRQALFNSGNAYAGAKKLQEALNAYNQLLVLDPHNRHAVHNRDVVKKMLEQSQDQQQSQGNTQKQQQQDKQHNGSPQQKDNSQSSENGQQQKQQAGDKNSARGGQQQGQRGEGKSDNSQNGSQKNGSFDQQNKRGSDKNTSQGQHSEQQGQGSSEETHGKKQGAETNSRNQDNQKRDEKNGEQLDERDSYKERYSKRDNGTDRHHEEEAETDQAKQAGDVADNQEGDNQLRAQQHKSSPSQLPNSGVSRDNAPKGGHAHNSTIQPMKVGGKVQDSAKKGQKKQYAAWAEAMLDTVQRNDESLNKILVQRAVAGTLGGRDGECCW